MTQADLPTDVLAAAAEALRVDPSGVRLDPGLPSSSRVWRASAGEQTVYVKLLDSGTKFEQARRALTGWGPALGRMPELLGSRPSGPGGLLVLNALPGVSLAKTPFDIGSSSEWEAPVRSAGVFLRDLHSLPVEDPDPVPLADALIARARAWAERAAPHVDAGSIRQAVDLVTAAARAEPLARVPSHRDFGPHNWLVDRGKVAVIDWEHARPDTPFADLERATEGLDSVLTEVFLDGYGDDRTLVESPNFRAQMALAALARIAWAVPRGDRAFEASGRARLAAALA